MIKLFTLKPYTKFVGLSLVFFFLTISTCLGQQKNEDTKYPSLLWEISGNGLEENSYLYGTMHVSEKVAYHLSDSFFENVIQADAIALETNPELWLDEIQQLPDFYNSYSYYYDNSFYKSFAFAPLTKDDLVEMFFLSENLINGILYRKSDFNYNYEESTYLDMFLYQVGRRTGKDVISLENYRESNDLALQAEMNNADSKPNSWVQEQLQNASYDELLSDAYREKNLDFIDSLNVGLNSEKYMDLMITERNRNMVDRLIPILNDGKTVFSGVGAAHLPGDHGMIEMLREEGYNVEPILGEYTEKGKNKKKELDQQYVSNKLKLATTTDNDFSILSPNKVHDFSLYGFGIFVGLDLPNSSYLSVTKAPRRDYLRKDKYRLTTETLDSLYFENIPGDILEKKSVTIDGYDGWDIKSETKSGHRQRYLQLLTPLELITVVYNGNDKFIEDYEDEIINSIKTKEIKNEWERVEPFQKGFSVKLPDNNIIYNNSTFTAKSSNPIIEGFDDENDSYYFIQQRTLGDVAYLEETKFELERIAYVFLDQLEVDTLNSHFNKKKNIEFYTSGELGNNQNIHLKTFHKGPYYYLMGSTGNESQTQEFFDSFQHQEFNYFNEKVNYIDSTMHFSVRTNIDVTQYDYRGNENNKNVFESIIKTRTFSSEAKQKIDVEYYQFHKYKSYDNIDSLWMLLQDDYNYKSFAKQATKSSTDDGWNVLDLELTDTLNEQRIKTRYLQKGARLYTIQTLVESDFESDGFINDFFESFTPKDTVIGQSIFEDKSHLFFKDIHHEADSIRNSAWKSISHIEFKPNDLGTLQTLLTDYEYEDERKEFETDIYSAIGGIDSSIVNPFIQDQYKKLRGESDIQVQILKSIANSEDQDKYESILNLMEYDLPLPASTWQLSSLFDSFYDDIENSKELLPVLFQFYSVEEYKGHLARFSQHVLDSTTIKKKYKKQIEKSLITNAKLELKRIKSRLNSIDNLDKELADYQLSDLKTYVGLMYHFKDQKDVQLFLEDVKSVEDSRIQLMPIENEIKQGIQPSQADINSMLEKKDDLFHYYYTIYQSESTSLLKQFPEESIALSLLKKDSNFDEEKDSIEFIKVEQVSTMRYENQEDYKVFFIKTKYDSEWESPTWKMNYIGFKLDENKLLEPENYMIQSNLEFFSEKDLDKIYKSGIDQVLNRDKRRTVFTYY